MMEVITALALMGAAGNVILGVALCFAVYKRRQENAVPENRERAEVGKVRIISPYINKKRGDGR